MNMLPTEFLSFGSVGADRLHAGWLLRVWIFGRRATRIDVLRRWSNVAPSRGGVEGM